MKKIIWDTRNRAVKLKCVFSPIKFPWISSAILLPQCRPW